MLVAFLVMTFHEHLIFSLNLLSDNTRTNNVYTRVRNNYKKYSVFTSKWGGMKKKVISFPLQYNVPTPSFQPALSRMAPRGGGGEKKSAPYYSGISNPPSSDSSNKVKLEKGFSRGTLDLPR